MLMLTNDQIKTIAQAIDAKFSIDKIYLFGSYANGNPGKDSDLDICITTRLGHRSKIDLIHDIRREIFGLFNIALDILVYDNEEFQQRAALKTTLEYQILNQGILLNG